MTDSLIPISLGGDSKENLAWLQMIVVNLSKSGTRDKTTLINAVRDILVRNNGDKVKAADEINTRLRGN
jgi:hypothetical protein